MRIRKRAAGCSRSTCRPASASGTRRRPACGTRPRCSPAQSAAISSIPGIVFSGSVDGHLRGYSTTDGKVIFWDFDSVGPYKTVNEVPARGGSFDGPGPAIAGGMMFVSSGYARAGGMPGQRAAGVFNRRQVAGVGYCPILRAPARMFGRL